MTKHFKRVQTQLCKSHHHHFTQTWMMMVSLLVSSLLNHVVLYHSSALLLCGSHDCWGRVCVCVSSYIRVAEGGRAGLCIFLLLRTGLRWVIHTGSSLVTGGTSSSLLPSSVTISSSIQRPAALTSGCSSRVPHRLFLRWMGNLCRLRCTRTWGSGLSASRQCQGWRPLRSECEDAACFLPSLFFYCPCFL